MFQLQFDQLRVLKEIPATKRGWDKSSLIVVHNWNHSEGKKEISLKKQSLVIVCVRIIAGFADRDHWEIGSIPDWSLSANQAPAPCFQVEGLSFPTFIINDIENAIINISINMH